MPPIASITVKDRKNGRPEVHITAPAGTSSKELARLQEFAALEVVPKLTDLPSCPCLSGAEYHIHEYLRDVVLVDLEKMNVIDTPVVREPIDVLAQAGGH